jgi:hypothetical protein
MISQILHFPGDCIPSARNDQASSQQLPLDPCDVIRQPYDWIAASSGTISITGTMPGCYNIEIGLD